jgi:GNAT superfamily N-acetyltransferase
MMPGLEVRRLGRPDVPAMTAFLERDAPNNLFLLANLVQWGISSPYLRYFGAFRQGELVGVLMFFRHSAGICWEDADALPLFGAIFQQASVTALSGCRRQIEPWMPFLPPAVPERTLHGVFAVLSPGDLRPWPARGERLATPDDVDTLVELYGRNLLFTYQAREEHRRRLLETLEAGGKIAFIERDGRAVSAARTSAIGHGMAMIGGVVTLPNYRGQGYATACTGLLSQELIASGHTPYLVYNPGDPAASRVYQRLGFQPYDEWIVMFWDA